MKRWNSTGGKVESPEVDRFLEEVAAVCEKHGMALSHEDRHGGLQVVKLEDGDLQWLMDASDERESEAKANAYIREKEKTHRWDGQRWVPK